MERRARDLGKLVVIGAGNMGAAIIRGVIAPPVSPAVSLASVRSPAAPSPSGVPTGQSSGAIFPPANVIAVESDAARRAEMQHLGLRAVSTISDLTAADIHGAVVLLAVKPQMFEAVASAWLAAKLPADSLFVSIMAGVTIARITQQLAAPRIIRTMPNLPAQVTTGMTAIAAQPGADPHDLATVERLFSAVGKTVQIQESLMDAFTAVAGSGPAYVFYLAEAMQQAAADLGFSPIQADTMVRQTIAGAAKLLSERADTTPANLRASVTSKGGTTAAATATLDAHNVQPAIIAAIKAAAARGAELGKST